MKSTGKMTKMVLRAGLILLAVFSTRAVLAWPYEDCNDTIPPTIEILSPQNGDIVGRWVGTDTLCATVDDYNPCADDWINAAFFDSGDPGNWWGDPNRGYITACVCTSNGGCNWCGGDGWSYGYPDGPTTLWAVAWDASWNITVKTVTFTIDNTAPTPPTTCQGWSDETKSTSLISGETYSYSSPFFEWYGATDATSGIEGYYVYYGTDDFADPEVQGTFQTTCTYKVSADEMTPGNTYYLRIKSKDYAGNTSDVYNAFTYKYCSCSCEVLEIGKTYGEDIQSTGIIRRNSPDFDRLKDYYNGDIFFPDYEKTGADHRMQKGIIEPLENLVDSVNQEWNREVKLRITEAWDENMAHTLNSAHYEGRALDLTVSSRSTAQERPTDEDRAKYPCLGCLAINAGFDFVCNEGLHIHVTKDGWHVSPPGGMDISAYSPVDVIVIDPDGLTISKGLNEISGAIYTETDIDGDGKSDDRITIIQRKIGSYLINVTPEPNALATDVYSLEVIVNDQNMVLAKYVQIQDIPSQPYEFESTLNLPSSIEIYVGRHYNEQDNPNDLTYEFGLEVETDEMVELVEFVTPAGKRFSIPNEPRNWSGGICTWYCYEDNAYCWGYEADFSNEANLADYGDGTYTITVHCRDDSNDQTTVWFGIPETNDPVPQPMQKPVFTFPTHNAVTTSPVTFTWEPCTDANATSIWFGLEKENTDEEYVDIDLPVGATSSDPITLSEGTWEAELCFENCYDFNNVDGIGVEIGKYRENDSLFTVTNPADLNRNGIVNFQDFAIIALAWLTESGDAQWNPVCDISDPNDNVIDMMDVDVFTGNWLLGTE